jgi:hypothetical protein
MKSIGWLRRVETSLEVWSMCHLNLRQSHPQTGRRSQSCPRPVSP